MRGCRGCFAFSSWLMMPLMSSFCFFLQVHAENLQFMQNRDVYNADYFRFVLNLASCNAVSYVIVRCLNLVHAFIFQKSKA